MVENRKSSVEYKKIEDLNVYVQELIRNGAPIIIAEKKARIAARPGVPEKERIVSWSVDAGGRPLLEKDAMVSVDEAGIPDWVATKIDEEGNNIVDANGHINQWIISAKTFSKKYEAVPGHPGIYKPVGGPQKFIRLDEGIHIIQWGEDWNVDVGGYINFTNPDDMYVIAGRDFDDNYRIIK